MAYIRSALFWPLFLLSSAFWVTLAFLVAPFSSKWVGSVSRAWARSFLGLARLVLGVRKRVEGRAPPGPHLFAVKHGSMYETADSLLIGHEPVVVLKKELADIPGWGWAARRYGVIAIDRAGGAQALRAMLAQAKAGVAQGRSVVIFPEGTRVPVGGTPPLQAGFGGLYKAVGLPVVPVAVDSARVWRRGLLQRPGVIRYRFGDVIPPGLGREEAERRVHAAINAFEQAG